MPENSAGQELLLPEHATQAARQPELHPAAGERAQVPSSPLPAGFLDGAAVLFEAAGLPADPSSADEGFINLSEHSATEFIARCRQLRFWHREFATAG
jgi:hypothetical protein